MVKKICSILTDIVLVLLAILAGLMIVPNLLGYESMAVISGSMEPTIPVGSIIYAKECDGDQLVVGDVITYQMGSSRVTHRIEEIDYDTKEIITKGDANNTVDVNPVTFENVVGKVAFHLPLIGYISVYAFTPLGIAGVCGIAFVLILLHMIPEFFKKEEKS